MKNVICVTLILMAALNSQASDSASSNAKPGVVVKENVVANPALANKDSYYIDINGDVGESVNSNGLINQEIREIVSQDGSGWERMNVLQLISNKTGQEVSNSIIKFIEGNSTQDKAVFYKTMYASCSDQYYPSVRGSCYNRFLENGYQEYAFVDLREFEALSLALKVCNTHYYPSVKALCFRNILTKNLEQKYSYIIKGCASDGSCMFSGFLELIKQNNYYAYYTKLSI